MKIQVYACRLLIGLLVGLLLTFWSGWDLSNHAARPVLLAIFATLLPIERWYSLTDIKRGTQRLNPAIWCFGPLMGVITPTAMDITLKNAHELATDPSLLLVFLQWYAPYARTVTLVLLAIFFALVACVGREPDVGTESSVSNS